MSIQFKPEFGNTAHIAIVEKMDKLARKEKELAKKLQEAKGAVALKKEVTVLKKQIEGMINLANKNV